MQFLMHLEDAGLAARSLSVYAAAVSFWSRSLGLADPTKDFRIRKTLEGFRRSSPPQPDKQKPINPAVLSGLISLSPVLCLSPYEAAVFEAVFPLMFLGGFRLGELLCSSRYDI